MREFVNKVVIEGYLRENNLEAKRNDSGDDVISGSVIVSISEHNSIRAQIYVRKQKRDASGAITGENAQYAKLLKMLPQYTSSIATALNANKEMSFADAAEVASKVYVIGSLQEYVRGNGNEANDYSVRAFSFGFKTVDAAHPFNPHAVFDVECMVKAVQPIGDGKQVRVLGIIPEPYSSQGADILAFVAKDPQIAAPIQTYYLPNTTVRISGDLVNSYSTVVKEGVKAAFGRSFEPTTETVFVHELLIAGSTAPVDSTNPMAFQVEEMRDLLTKREQYVAERTEAVQKGGKPSAPAMPTPSKNWAFNMPTATAPAAPAPVVPVAPANQPPVMATPVIEDNTPPWAFDASPKW